MWFLQFGKEGAKLLVVRNVVNEFQGCITRMLLSQEVTISR